MKKIEALISRAYTGKLFHGVKFSDMHEIVEEKLGRPVFTHEFADELIIDEIKDKFKHDFIAMDVTDE